MRFERSLLVFEDSLGVDKWKLFVYRMYELL